jgi:hypothetical protein
MSLMLIAMSNELFHFVSGWGVRRSEAAPHTPPGWGVCGAKAPQTPP